jgi:hypothetical protein
MYVSPLLLQLSGTDAYADQLINDMTCATCPQALWSANKAREHEDDDRISCFCRAMHRDIQKLTISSCDGQLLALEQMSKGLSG